MGMFPDDLKSARVEVFVTTQAGIEHKALECRMQFDNTAERIGFETAMHGGLMGGKLSSNILLKTQEGLHEAIANAEFDHDAGDEK